MATPSPAEQPSRRPIAAAWHTSLLVVLIVAVAVTGTLLGSGGAALQPAGGRITSIYLPLLASEWGLVLYVWLAGLRPRRVSLRDLVGGSWAGGGALIDLLLALGGWLAVKGVELLWPGSGSAPLLPSGVAESAVWVLVALSAALCEELVFRGYLQRQLEAFSGSVAIAVLGQALLFGLAHAEQGPAAMTRIALYGLGLGVLARARKSLRPGILCHALIDLVSGLLRV